MSLSSAINTAQASLSNTATQTSVISRNISNASNPDYARRSAILSSTLVGANIVTTQRAHNDPLFREGLSSLASASGQQALLEGLEALKALYGGNDYESAPATLLANLRDTLATYSVKPSESTLAETAIAEAGQLAAGLRSTSLAVQDMRLSADQEISRQVNDLNDLLSQFQKINDAVVRGTASGDNINAELDQRDKLLKQISGIIGVNAVTRNDNDVALYTTDGATLFEKVPRPVTFQKSTGFSATLAGNSVYVDGVPLQPGQGATTTATGTLQAQLQIRDDYAPAMQRQLDEVARALVITFAEKDRTATPTLPDMPGLFVWSDGGVPGGVPAAGTLVPGLASTITVNTALITAQGGNPSLLRDGGINGAAYGANTTGGGSFSDLLDGYVTAMDEPMAFDVAAGLGPSASLSRFATDSVGWLELNRSDAFHAAESREAKRFRVMEAHSNSTGVSLDEEMSMLLELEQSYKASARLIAAVDEMLRTLLAVA